MTIYEQEPTVPVSRSSPDVDSTPGGALIIDTPPSTQPGMPPRIQSTVDGSFIAVLRDLFDNTQTLLRQEVELVKVETTEQVKAEVQEKGIAAGLIVGGGIFAILGLGFLGWVLIFGLAEWFAMSQWLSALIVTLLYFLIGGLLAFLGRSRLMSDDKGTTDLDSVERERVVEEPYTTT